MRPDVDSRREGIGREGVVEQVRPGLLTQSFDPQQPAARDLRAGPKAGGAVEPAPGLFEVAEMSVGHGQEGALLRLGSAAAQGDGVFQQTNRRLGPTGAT